MPLDIQNDGDGKVTYAAPAGLDLTGSDVTIVAKVYNRSFNATGGYAFHISSAAAVGLGLRMEDVGGGVYRPSILRANTGGGFASCQSGASGTMTAGRWYLMAGFSPADAIASDNSTTKTWLSINGVVTDVTGTPSAAPGGTERTLSTNICLGGRHYDGARNVEGMVGPVRVFARELSTAELQDIYDDITALDTDPALVFKADLKTSASASIFDGVSQLETVAGSVDDGSNGFAPMRHLPDWAGTTRSVLADWDFTRLSDGTLSSCTNEATFAGSMVPATDWTAPLIGTGPYGGRVMYVGVEPAEFLANRICEMNTDTGRPVVHNRYCTVLIVGYTTLSTRTNFNQIFATAASDFQIQMCSLNRIGLNTNITDALHRWPSSPTVVALALSSNPVRHHVGTDGAVTHASFVCGTGTPTSNAIRLGALTTATAGASTIFTRFHFQRVIVFEGVLTTAEINEIVAGLEEPYGLRLYRAGATDILVGEGASTAANSWDGRLKGGFVGRAAARSNDSTIVYNFGVGGDTETNMLAEDQDTVHHVIGPSGPHPSPRKTWLYYIGPGSNACDVLTPNVSTILTNIQSVITAAKTAGYDRVVVQDAHPRYFVTVGVDQDVCGQALADVCAGLPALTGVNRIIPSPLTDYSSTGSHTTETQYYAESSNRIHLNEDGHDFFEEAGMGSAWLVENGGINRGKRLVILGV